MKKTITRLVAVCLSGILALQTPLFQINAYGMEPYAPKGEVEYPGDIDPLFHLANLDLCDDNQQIPLGNVEFSAEDEQEKDKTDLDHTAGCYSSEGQGSSFILRSDNVLRSGPETVSGNYTFSTYECDEKTYAKITKYSGNETDIEIPDTLCGYEVGMIGDEAFRNNENIQKLTIPDTVKEIGSWTFRDCHSLSEVTLPSDLQRMGYGSFYGTYISEITIPKSLETVSHDNYRTEGYTTFAECSQLKTVNFEEGTEKIPVNLFRNCDSLESIVIPDTVTEIGENAFRDCDNIQAVTFPDVLKTIGGEAFRGCTKLGSIVIPDEVTTIGIWAFRDCSILETATLSKNLKSMGYGVFCGTAISEITIPKSLETVSHDNYRTEGYTTFAECSQLKTVNFEEGTEKIPTNLFRNCDSLERIDIPDTVTEIGENAFRDCDGFSEIILPQNLKSIWSSAFRQCNGLVRMDIPDSVENLGESVFDECDALVDVYVGKKANAIGNCFFYGCDNLKNVVLEEKVSSIGTEAFINCNNLENVTVLSKTADLGRSCLNNNGKLKLHLVKNLKALKYAIEKNIHYSLIAGLPSEGKYINHNKSRYIREKSVLNADGTISVRIDYEIKPEIEVRNSRIIVFIPEDQEFSDKSLLFNGTSSMSHSISERNLVIPVTQRKGVITFRMKPETIGRISGYAIFSKDSEEELIGVLAEERSEGISIEGPKKTASSEVFVEGITKPDTEVIIYVNDEEDKRVRSKGNGRYTAAVNINNPQNGRRYRIKAECSYDGKEYSAEYKLKYDNESVCVKDVRMYYRQHTDDTYSEDLLNKEKNRVISFNPKEPYTFEVVVTNPEKVDKVYINSKRNGEIRRMECIYDPARGSYVASGRFDESDEYYVPGELSVSFTTKSKEPYNVDFDSLSVRDDIKDKCKFIIIDTDDPDNTSHFQLDITELLKSAYPYEFDGVGEVPPQIIDYLVTRNISKETVSTRIKQATYSSFDSQDLAGNACKVYFNRAAEISRVIMSPADGVLESTAVEIVITPFCSLIQKDPELIAGIAGLIVQSYEEYQDLQEAMESFEDYKEVINGRVDLTKEQKNQLIKEAENRLYFRSFFSLLEIGGAALATFAPEFASVGVAIALIGTAGKYLLDHWDEVEECLNEIKLTLLTWLIDPSGTVYEAVTTNPVEGVLSKAMYKESEIDSGPGILWDSAYCEQENPQLTDYFGRFSWDVPEAWWQVVFSKKGYSDAKTEWLYVPPERVGLQVRMKSKSIPEIEGVNAYTDKTEILFGKYMKPKSVNKIRLQDEDGKNIAYTLDYPKTETDDKGVVYSRSFELIYQSSIKKGTKLQVVFNNGILSADDIPLQSCERTLTVKEKSSIIADSDITVNTKSVEDVSVRISEYDPSVKIEAETNRLFVSVSDVELDNNGEGTLHIAGNMIGETEVVLRIAGTDISKTIHVTVQPGSEGSIAVSSVKLSEKELTLHKGNYGRLKASISPLNADNKKVFWRSDNESVISVDDNGSYYAESAGTARIFARTEDGGFEDSCTIKVEETSVLHTISSTSGKGGIISPSGMVMVEHGGSKTFNIKADTGYEIEDIKVDGESVGVNSEYTFNNVTGDHTLFVSFSSKQKNSENKENDPNYENKGGENKEKDPDNENEGGENKEKDPDNENEVEENKEKDPDNENEGEENKEKDPDKEKDKENNNKENDPGNNGREVDPKENEQEKISDNNDVGKEESSLTPAEAPVLKPVETRFKTGIFIKDTMLEFYNITHPGEEVKKVKFKSSNKKIVKVNNKGRAKGGKMSGTASITMYVRIREIVTKKNGKQKKILGKWKEAGILTVNNTGRQE